MAAEADVPCLLPESRMVSSIDRLALGRYIIKVNIQNGSAVQNHSNLSSFDGDSIKRPQIVLVSCEQCTQCFSLPFHNLFFSNCEPFWKKMGSDLIQDWHHPGIVILDQTRSDFHSLLSCEKESHWVKRSLTRCI